MTASIWIVQDELQLRIARRGSGVVASIRTCSGAEILKFDIFGRSHWHIYCFDGREVVEPLRSDDPVAEVCELLARLPELLGRGGYATLSERVQDCDWNGLSEPDVRATVDRLEATLPR